MVLLTNIKMATCATAESALECVCEPESVMSNGCITVYPLCKLISFQGLLLMRYPLSSDLVVGVHKFEAATDFLLHAYNYEGHWYMCFSMRYDGGATSNFNVLCVGVQRVRTVQRWWRARLLERRLRNVAVGMGGHMRLGASSPLYLLDDAILRMFMM